MKRCLIARAWSKRSLRYLRRYNQLWFLRVYLYRFFLRLIDFRWVLIGYLVLLFQLHCKLPILFFSWISFLIVFLVRVPLTVIQEFLQVIVVSPRCHLDLRCLNPNFGIGSSPFVSTLRRQEFGLVENLFINWLQSCWALFGDYWLTWWALYWPVIW